MKVRYRDHSSVSSLTHELRHWIQSRQGSVAIVAGHYMLDLLENNLIPMVAGQDIPREHADNVQYYAGGFPLRTFRIGLELVESVNGHGHRLALLVNDHFFVHGLDAEERDELSIRQLRQEYFRREDAIPAAYRAELARRGLTVDDILLLNERPASQPQDLLPARSYFFSEQALRNRFDNVSRKRLSTLTNFWEEQIEAAGPPSLFFGIEGATGDRMCLTDEGRCGCKGEIIELAYAFGRLGFEHALLLIPDECHAAVNSAALASVHGAEALSSMAVVTGLGGRGERPGESCWRPSIIQYDKIS